MKPELVSIKKSESFGKKVNGEVRFVVVCRFKDAEGGRFATSFFGNTNPYTNSMDLREAYGKDSRCKNDDGEFDGEKAFKFFKDEFTEEEYKDIKLLTIDLGKTYIFERADGTEQEMRTHNIAWFGSTEKAREYVMRGIERDLKMGRIHVKEEQEHDAGGE